MMRILRSLPSIAAFVILLSACATQANDPAAPGSGPFIAEITGMGETLYSTSFEEVADPALAGIMGTNASVTVNKALSRSEAQSLEVLRVGEDEDFSIDLPMRFIAGQTSLDLADKAIAISVFVPRDSPIRTINFGFRGSDRFIIIPVREDAGIMGRWFCLSIDLGQAAANPRTIIYGHPWNDAMPSVRRCESLSVVARVDGGKPKAKAGFLVDDLVIAARAELVEYAEAESLKAHAPHGLFIGTTYLGERYLLEPSYLSTLGREFNFAWIAIASDWPKERPAVPEAIDFDYSVTDSLVRTAARFGLGMKMWAGGWHILLPRWLMDYPFDGIKSVIVNRVAKDMGRYKGRVVMWDVFDEVVMSDPGPGGDRLNNRQAKNDGTVSDEFMPYGAHFSPWVDGTDSSIIEAAFLKARQADPKAALYLNEFGNEQIGKPKSEFFYRFVMGLKGKGVPIDGVGFQLHLFLDGDKVGYDQTPIGTFLQDVDKNVKRYAAKGLRIEFSEVEVGIRCDDLDLSKPAGRKTYEQRLQAQARLYRGLMKIAKENANVSAFILWEVSDLWSSIMRMDYPERMAFGDAAVFDSYGRPKPAYYAMLEELKGGGN
jgi:endo-1,4-beta-xylanase